MKTAEELFNENLKLVTFAIKRATANHSNWFKSYHYDDVKQHAYLALYKACQTYKPELGEFSTYAVMCIIRDIGHYVDRVTHYRRKGHATSLVSLNEPVGDGLTIADIVEDKQPDDVTWIWTDKRLNDEQKNICKMTYEGYTQEEIGKKINCSRGMVNKKLIQIRKIFKEDENV